MNKKYDLAVYIGRFQPFHLGHLHAIKNALELADKVLVVIGSANAARNPKNPFTEVERFEMIRAACAENDEKNGTDYISRVSFEAIADFYDDNDWLIEAQKLITAHSIPNAKVCIVGHEKDDSTFYLRMFPQYGFEDFGYLSVEDSRCMDATRVRELLFTEEFAFIKGVVPDSIFNWLMKWKKTPIYSELKEYHEFIVKYKQQWSVAPYPVNFVAADAVVVQSGHVLLITRGAFPGKGLLALPGGYVDPQERVFDAAMRELYEETQIKMDRDVLRRCVAAERTYDDPRRSLHGRVITTAYLFRLKDTKKLPVIKGSDDAASARWVPLSEITPEKLYTDHYHIIQDLLGRAKH